MAVSNFVLPLYFTVDAEEGSRNDFLGRRHNDAMLGSFGVNPGGYVGFFNPATGKTEIFTADARAQARMKIKESLKNARARRATRYRTLNTAAVKKAA